MRDQGESQVIGLQASAEQPFGLPPTQQSLTLPHVLFLQLLVQGQVHVPKKKDAGRRFFRGPLRETAGAHQGRQPHQGSRAEAHNRPVAQAEVLLRRL